MAKLIQATLGILKPDLFIRYRHVRPLQNLASVPERQVIHSLIKEKQFQIECQQFKLLSLEEAETFYSEHKGKFFYQRLISFITSGPLEILVLKAPNAILEWRSLMGPTHVQRARKEAPQSIRGRFSFSDTRNIVHGSGLF